MPKKSKQKKSPASRGTRTATVARFCEACHLVFFASRQDARYCSPKCRKWGSRWGGLTPPTSGPPPAGPKGKGKKNGRLNAHDKK